MRVPLLVGLLGTAFLFSSAHAHAESTDDDDARYERVLTDLTKSHGPQRTWGRVWTGTYAALAVGQGVFAWAVQDEGLRADAAVGAVKTALGLFAMLFSPRTAVWAAPSLREMDGTTPQAKRLRRLRAEELLHRSAREQNFSTSWVPHIAAAATNLAGSFVLFHYYDRHFNGWVSLASGTFVSELQILTHPTGSIGAWNRYVEASGSVPPGSSAPFSAWSIAPGPRGFVLRGSF